MQYFIVIPAHNEAAFLSDTLDAVCQQSLLPQKVIVVNDNSTDSTENIIDAYVSKNPLFQKVNTQSSQEHMPGSKVINAFNAGLEKVDTAYDFIVKLDADIVLPPFYFEEIAGVFKKQAKVGVAGGFAYEQEADGSWQLNHPMNKNHVRGAFKAYTKDCFEAIGGLKNAMGWDTVDELLAQYHGFEIHTNEALKAKHLRPLGNAYNAKAKLLQGKAMYRLRYGFWISAIASIKMAYKQNKPKAFFHNLKGFFKAKREKAPFLVSKEEGIFIRALRWNGIKKKLF